MFRKQYTFLVTYFIEYNAFLDVNNIVSYVGLKKLFLYNTQTKNISSFLKSYIKSVLFVLDKDFGAWIFTTQYWQPNKISIEKRTARSLPKSLYAYVIKTWCGVY